MGGGEPAENTGGDVNKVPLYLAPLRRGAGTAHVRGESQTDFGSQLIETALQLVRWSNFGPGSQWQA